MTTTTTNILKSQFTQYLHDNFEFEYIKVQEHAELNLNSTYRYGDKEAKKKAMSDISRSDYVIESIFDIINDYTDIDFDDESTLKDLDFEELLDKSGEYADGMADIYNSDCYNSFGLFSEDIEDAMNEFGYPEKPDLVKIIQIGQYYFYDRFYRWSIRSLESFLEEHNA
jgi:hypothetical protein